VDVEPPVEVDDDDYEEEDDNLYGDNAVGFNDDE
jgi:hypothetical protein